MTPEFGELIRRAYGGGADVCLLELVRAMDLPIDDLLGGVIEVDKTLQALKLSLNPPISTGDFETRRALLGQDRVSAVQLTQTIEQDEHGQIEFKSTLVCDLRAKRASPRSCREVTL